MTSHIDFIGRSFEIARRDQESVIAKMVGLNEKKGKMKDGSEKNYIDLVTVDGTTCTIHPRSFDEVVKKGEANGIKLIEAEKETAQEHVENVVETSNVMSMMASTIIDQETTQNVVSPNTVTQKLEAPQNGVPSKRQRCEAIYKEGTVAQQKRKDIIARMMAEVGMTDKGAATYYQNFKNGPWKVTI